MTGYHEITRERSRSAPLPPVLQAGHSRTRSRPSPDGVMRGYNAFRTEFSDADYDRVLVLGREYLSRNPRSLA